MKIPHERITPPPAASTIAASSAPPANGARKKLRVTISPTARTIAAIIQKTHPDIAFEPT